MISLNVLIFSSKIENYNLICGNIFQVSMVNTIIPF